VVARDKHLIEDETVKVVGYSLYRLSERLGQTIRPLNHVRRAVVQARQEQQVVAVEYSAGRKR
jgi:hypothetical protein